MATYSTQKVLTELRDIISASSLSPITTINELQPIASVTGDVVVDISLETIILDLDRLNPGRVGYSRTFLINVHIAANCTEDKLRIFDVTDGIEDSILNDNALWATVINRDIVSINYDQGQTPYRGSTILVEAIIRLDCIT